MSVDGRTVDKSDRLRGGSWLEVSWAPKQALAIVPIAVPDLGIVYDDDDIVVVDKPVGVAAHPSVGWKGPTVVGALAAAGFRISTSGPPSAPASCTASTPAPAASWSSRRASRPTRP